MQMIGMYNCTYMVGIWQLSWYLVQLTAPSRNGRFNVILPDAYQLTGYLPDAYLYLLFRSAIKKKNASGPYSLYVAPPSHSVV